MKRLGCSWSIAKNKKREEEMRPLTLVLPRNLHKEKHQLLYKLFNELIDDYAVHHPRADVGKLTILELLEWSYAETINPTETVDDRPFAS